MRRVCLLIGLLCLFVILPAAAAPPEEGLVLWFGFNEDVDPDIDDLSGTGNNGSIAAGGVKWTANGKYGGGMEFTNGRIVVPNSETITFDGGFTVSLWLKSEDVPDAYRHLINYGWAGNGSYILGIDNHWMNMAFAWDVKNVGGTRFDANMDALVIPGEWQFVAGTYDGAVIKLYVNGEMKVQGAANGKMNGMNDLSISTEGLGQEGGSFIGIFDEVRIYNRALSADEIMDAMDPPAKAAVSPGNALSTAWGAVKL